MRKAASLRNSIMIYRKMIFFPSLWRLILVENEEGASAKTIKIRRTMLINFLCMFSTQDCNWVTLFVHKGSGGHLKVD